MKFTKQTKNKAKGAKIAPDLVFYFLFFLKKFIAT